MVKAAYTKKLKDANRRGDEATAARLEKACDAIMMVQLTKRKKGETVVRLSFWIKNANDTGLTCDAGERFGKRDQKRKGIGRLAEAPSSPAQSKRPRKFKASD